MAIDFQDFARRLFKTAETLWTHTVLRPRRFAKPASISGYPVRSLRAHES